MKNFENELLVMVKNIEFKNVMNESQEKLKHKNSDKILQVQK